MNEIVIVLIIAVLFIIISFFIGRAVGKRFMFEVMNHVLEKEKEKALNKSRAVIKGQLQEQFAPFSVDFPCSSTECNFQGKPIDFIGFKGLDNKYVEEVLFIEIKTGTSQLSQVQKSVKKAIEEKRVRFVEVRV
ncbi:MAG: hypothetical protein LAT82_02475 [Nanoarchaeota archaeon]|nr:hypothetical protein [Nanoarchaeota archaeon]